MYMLLYLYFIYIILLYMQYELPFFESLLLSKKSVILLSE